MTKLFGGVVGMIMVAVLWHMRKGAMKDRLKAFDNGTMCINCHSRNMSVTDGKARCGDCFHVADIAAMQAAVITDQQIHDVTRPQN